MIIHTADIAQKFLDLLTHISAESQEVLQNELLKIVPSEESKVIIRAGGGHFPAEDKYDIGILIQVYFPQTDSKPQSLDLLIYNLFNYANEPHQEVFFQLLEGFQTTLPPYDFCFTEARMLNETMAAFHFSLTGYLKTKT